MQRHTGLSNHKMIPNKGWNLITPKLQYSDGVSWFAALAAHFSSKHVHA